MSSVVFRGLSGTDFYFRTWPLDTRFKAIGGVFIVSKRSYDDPTFRTRATHEPVLIGHTDDLATGLISVAQRGRLARDKGANCLCILAVADAARRVEIAADLTAGNERLRGMRQALKYLVEPSRSA